MRFLVPDGTTNGFAIVGGTTPQMSNTTYAAEPLNGGTLYEGTVREIFNPTYPYNFEKSVVGDDRVSLSGKRFYNIRYTNRKGLMNFNDLNETQTGYLRDLFDETLGFRVPFVIEFPLTLELIRVISDKPGSFDFSMQFFDGYQGSISLEEYVA